jgi:hypothetical protein
MRRWILGLVLVLILSFGGVWLWRWSGDDLPGHGILGGPLFDFSADQIEALEIRRLQGTTFLRQQDDGIWILSGLVNDIVSPDHAQAALTALADGIGFPLMIGTQPGERRFGFGGGDAVELVFHLRGGDRQRLAVGDFNPVTDMFYASGASRPGVFGVGGQLYETVSRLPHSIRMPGLLPRLRAADLDSLYLGRRGDQTLVLARLDDDRWWMRHRADSPPLVGMAARYHERYHDRQREHGGALWLLADERRTRDLVYITSGAKVTMLGPDRLAEPDLQELGLDPPYRTLELWVRGGPTWRASFGQETSWHTGQNMVPAIRQSAALVMLKPEALLPLLGPVSGFLDLGALSFRCDIADSFRIDEPDRPVLWCRRAEDEQERIEVHRSIWDPVVPEGWSLTFDRELTSNHLTDLHALLDRLECLEVLDPVAQNPLRTADRWLVRFWLPDDDLHEVWFGRMRDDGRPVVWTPENGSCLVVPEVILTTLQNMRYYLTRR